MSQPEPGCGPDNADPHGLLAVELLHLLEAMATERGLGVAREAAGAVRRAMATTVAERPGREDQPDG